MSLTSFPWLPALAFAVISGLGACGGGGSASSSASSAASGATSGAASGVASGAASAPAPDLVLSGVAAVGAPLGSAQVSVVDAKGKSLGTTSTRGVDGVYSLVLGSKTPTGPLFVQARGVDAAGNPQVLHSTVATPAAAMVANITPLSDAAVALALGTDPRPVFNAAADNTTLLASLGQAKAAGDFLKTVIKNQLSDLKITDATKVDLFGDVAFAANKGSGDLLVESLRVVLGKGPKGEQQLQLGAKLLNTLAPEVIIDLATAKAELAKTTGATPANAITTTVKVTSSFAALVPNLGVLDDLGAAINRLIAQGSSSAVLAASPLLASYVRHNGRQPSDLADLLATYAARNWQLGRFLVTGCADDKAITGNCTRVQVAALVTDSSGAVTDLFNDVVGYTAKPAAGVLNWGLVGNGRKLDFSVRATSWLARGADGTPASATAPSGNPSAGVQLLLQGQDSQGNEVLQSATVQTPSGFSIALAGCVQPRLCISAATGATSVPATGALGDTLLQPATVGWVGGADTVRNARYQASYTLDGAAETRVALLGGDLSANGGNAARYPSLDGVSATAPLSRSALAAGLTLTWANWAAANPELRLTGVQVVLRQDAVFSSSDVPVLPGVNRVTLPAMVDDPAQPWTSAELWLHSQDSLGRRLVSRYDLKP
jgi:hypothetical protein